MNRNSKPHVVQKRRFPENQPTVSHRYDMDFSARGGFGTTKASKFGFSKRFQRVAQSNCKSRVRASSIVVGVKIRGSDCMGDSGSLWRDEHATARPERMVASAAAHGAMACCGVSMRMKISRP